MRPRNWRLLRLADIAFPAGAVNGGAHVALNILRRCDERLRDLRIEIAAQIAQQAFVQRQAIERFCETGKAEQPRRDAGAQKRVADANGGRRGRETRFNGALFPCRFQLRLRRIHDAGVQLLKRHWLEKEHVRADIAAHLYRRIAGKRSANDQRRLAGNGAQYAQQRQSIAALLGKAENDAIRPCLLDLLQGIR